MIEVEVVLSTKPNEDGYYTFKLKGKDVKIAHPIFRFVVNSSDEVRECVYINGERIKSITAINNSFKY